MVNEYLLHNHVITVYYNKRGGEMARKKFTTNLDEEVIKRLKIKAAEECTDASKIIEKLLLKYLNELNK